MVTQNTLYYGDNLDILRKSYIKDESVDLVYLDPPFKSNQNYNKRWRKRSRAAVTEIHERACQAASAARRV